MSKRHHPHPQPAMKRNADLVQMFVTHRSAIKLLIIIRVGIYWTHVLNTITGEYIVDMCCTQSVEGIDA